MAKLQLVVRLIMTKALTLFLPDLLASELLAVHTAKAPHISRVIGRATPTQAGHDATLKLFFQGLFEPVPVGALGAYAHGLVQQKTAQWCQADLVTYLADHKTVYLSSLVDLSDKERLALAACLNHFLQQDNLKLEQGNRTWFCKLSKEAIFCDPLTAIGKDLRSFLPSGINGAYWQRLMTECEFLLATSEINQQRAQKKAPLISGLWFWGEGTLPQNIKTTYDKIYSDNSAIWGLAKCAQTDWAALPACFSPKMLDNKQNILLIDQRFSLYKAQNHGAWHRLFDDYERHWFEPLLAALAQNHIKSLCLFLGQKGQFHLTKKHLRYFWRRPQSLAEFS